MKKKQRAKMFLVEVPAMSDAQDSGATDDLDIPPPTPIQVMQRVGAQLGVDPTKITAKKLGADLVMASSDVEDD
jgi:hypothetical protein